MKNYINGIDFVNMEAMKYWSFPKSYKKDKHKEIKNLIFSGDYWGALKVDGYYQRLVKDEDGNCFMIARSKNVNGEAVNKIEWVPQIQPFMDNLPNGTSLLCECYLPGNEGSKKITSLLGCLKEKCIKRQTEGYGMLHLYVFDVAAYNGISYMETSSIQRFELLEKISKLNNNEYVEFAKYYNGAELWEMLQNYLASGREGMVITRSDCQMYNKRTPARMTIKVKQELRETVDVVITGANPPTKEYNGKYIEDWEYWIDNISNEKIKEKKYKEYAEGAPLQPITKNFFNGWAGSLKIGIYKEGKLITIGSISGLTEEILEHWKDYVGKVAEVSAMQIFEDSHMLRHPIFIQWREDKEPKECNWEQLLG